MKLEEYIEAEIESPITFPMSMANVPKSNASVDSETGDFCLGDLELVVSSTSCEILTRSWRNPS